ncbi:hypothetical protein QUG92_15735 [Curtobacterium sp. RHCKG23]|uniref:Secreted protein n=1 Tax=Curtobacterium citri TaxID=3055139 RepID=A0ABT7TC76_9MICO|nr:hypothetical protein [Curtobacterium citri]MDM7886562.1 hypothetical protein [Curtobacterium citri]
MSVEWTTFVSGLVGAVLGAGGAVGTTVITTRSNRKAREDDRTEDRKDRAAEREHERVARLRDQGRNAAREALAISSQFFAETHVPGEPYRAMDARQRTEVQRIEDLAELIENDDARAAVRSAVAGLLGASVVERAADYVDPDPEVRIAHYATYWRERKLLTLIRKILGSYLREDETALTAARLEAEGAEQAVEHAFGILES